MLPAQTESQPAPTYYRPDKLVRTDARASTMDQYLANPLKAAAAGETPLRNS